jgi:hypothetical protein
MPDSSAPGDAPPITRTHMNYNNDYPVFVRDVEDPAYRLKTCRAGAVADARTPLLIRPPSGKRTGACRRRGYDTPVRRREVDAWIRDMPELAPFRPVLLQFSIMPYARESRRIVGLHSLTAREIDRHPGSPVQFADAVALGITRSTCTVR